MPSLRNIAVKQAYFHNGVFHTLQDVVNFYITRDIDPGRWYLKGDGATVDTVYNDLPVQFDANVNVLEVPYNPAVSPALTPAERQDLIAFLCTLSDGFDPTNPGAYDAIGAPTNPAQCQQARR